MLTCQSCMRRCLQNLVGDSVVLAAALPVSHTKTLRRTFPSTRASGERRYSGRDLQTRRQQSPGSGNVWLADKSARAEFDSGFVVRKHLQYLKDPVKLAEFVRQELRAGEYESTLELVRKASKQMQCIVSWNHMIDYLLSNGKTCRMNDAIKLYNEMKKRAQPPDNHTYTIIFRGCAEHPDSKAAVAKVLSIYHSMTLDSSKVKPNAIHVNALLKVCSRAHDMDAMFSIVSTLPEVGPGSPNNLTYTTVINAIRMNIVADVRRHTTPMQKRQLVEDGLLKVRRLWVTIIKRWETGDIFLDEELVCATARTLLVGGPQDHDDVFSLVAQAMNIPRQLPGSNSPSPQTAETTAFPTQGSPEYVFDEKNPESELEIMKINEFQPIPHYTPGTYAKPGRNTLSVLLQAILGSELRSISTKKVAMYYWSTITTQYHVSPDADNYHALLRILRVARASSDAVDVISQMQPQDLEAKTFKIAFSTCERDRLNPHVFSNAGKLLDLMQTPMQSQVAPTKFVEILGSYLEIALKAPASPANNSNRAKDNTSKHEYGQRILRALDRLNPSYVNLKSLAAFGNPTSKGRVNAQQSSELLHATLLLTRRMIGALDILIQQALVPDNMKRDVMAQRAKLAAFNARVREEAHKSGPLDRVQKRVSLKLEAEAAVRAAARDRADAESEPAAANLDLDAEPASHAFTSNEENLTLEPTTKQEMPRRRQISLSNPTRRENAQNALARAVSEITDVKLSEGLSGAALRQTAEDALMRAAESPNNESLQRRAMRAVQKVIEADKLSKAKEAAEGSKNLFNANPIPKPEPLTMFRAARGERVMTDTELDTLY